jgi:heme-degrading monooxygenase HmoA
MSTDNVDWALFAEATVVRVWTTEIDIARADDYDEFVRTMSVPMFQRQAGFVAALFCGEGRVRVVLTLWRNRGAVDALRASETYRETVSEIEAAGFLQGSQTTEIFELHSHTLSRKPGSGGAFPVPVSQFRVTNRATQLRTGWVGRLGSFSAATANELASIRSGRRSPRKRPSPRAGGKRREGPPT